MLMLRMSEHGTSQPGSVGKHEKNQSYGKNNTKKVTNLEPRRQENSPGGMKLGRLQQKLRVWETSKRLIASCTLWDQSQYLKPSPYSKPAYLRYGVLKCTQQVHICGFVW